MISAKKAEENLRIVLPALNNILTTFDKSRFGDTPDCEPEEVVRSCLTKLPLVAVRRGWTGWLVTVLSRSPVAESI